MSIIKKYNHELELFNEISDRKKYVFYKFNNYELDELDELDEFVIIFEKILPNTIYNKKSFLLRYSNNINYETIKNIIISHYGKSKSKYNMIFGPPRLLENEKISNNDQIKTEIRFIYYNECYYEIENVDEAEEIIIEKIHIDSNYFNIKSSINLNSKILCEFIIHHYNENTLQR